MGGQIKRKKKLSNKQNYPTILQNEREIKTFPDKQKLEEFVAKQTYPMRNTKGSPTD